MLARLIRNLWHAGSLFHWSTWRSAARLLFSKDGMIRGNTDLWRAYKAPTFHPRQQDTSRSAQWLRNNSNRFTVVGQPT
jgi:predicted metal-dependent hydrolase